MRQQRQTRALGMAGKVLKAAGAVLIAGVGYYCYSGGIELLSPVAALTALWPVAALLIYLGQRMQQAADPQTDSTA